MRGLKSCSCQDDRIKRAGEFRQDKSLCSDRVAVTLKPGRLKCLMNYSPRHLCPMEISDPASSWQLRSSELSAISSQ